MKIKFTGIIRITNHGIYLGGIKGADLNELIANKFNANSFEGTEFAANVEFYINNLSSKVEIIDEKEEEF